MPALSAVSGSPSLASPRSTPHGGIPATRRAAGRWIDGLPCIDAARIVERPPRPRHRAHLLALLLVVPSLGVNPRHRLLLGLRSSRCTHGRHRHHPHTVPVRDICYWEIPEDRRPSPAGNNGSPCWPERGSLYSSVNREFVELLTRLAQVC